MDPLNAQPSQHPQSTAPAAQAQRHDAQPAAPAEPAAPQQGAAPAPGQNAGPNRKGLPPIARATVINAPGGPGDRRGQGPGIGGPGGRPGGGSSGGSGSGPGGGRGPRPDRGPGRDQRSSAPGPEKAPDTHATLRAVSDEARVSAEAPDGPLDASAEAQIEAMLTDIAAQESQRQAPRRAARPAPDVQVQGGRAAAPIRGPRVVQSGREHRTGKVVSVGPTDMFVEFGPKELGVVSRTQFKDDELPAVGSALEVVVDRFSAEESLFLCSRPGTVVKAAWEMLEVGQIVEARVTGTNKGGLELEVAGHRAFMPASQASLDRIPDLSVLIGEKFPAVVTQLDKRGAGNIVLSRRDLLAEERKKQAAQLRATLAVGQTLEGTVRKIMPFGALIDLGGLDGLCHITEMTYDRAIPSEKNVARYVKEGQKVRVQVLKIDDEAGRIALGMKQLADDPFMSAAGALAEGADVTGRVVRLTEFGAFVEVSPGVDGLIHVSEIARRRIEKPGDVLKVDQVVTARVLKIDRDGRKLSLSIKALTPVEPPAPGSREAIAAEKRAARDKASAERLAEISKETPALRRQREKFRGKQLTGGFGDSALVSDSTASKLGLTLGKN
ncbi:MAG: hypothetical protein C0475_04825 [Planctomyces sp.]|nr:hypothetical protein [Planctomyces sp.]